MARGAPRPNHRLASETMTQRAAGKLPRRLIPVSSRTYRCSGNEAERSAAVGGSPERKRTGFAALRPFVVPNPTKARRTFQHLVRCHASRVPHDVTQFCARTLRVISASRRATATERSRETSPTPTRQLRRNTNVAEQDAAIDLRSTGSIAALGTSPA
jgi:hypothetical protein